MGAINNNNSLKFKSSAELFATLRVDLESYDSMGLLNNQKFYRHIKYILERLGLYVYEEYNGIVEINSYVGVLPANFSKLHAAYRMSASNNSKTFTQDLGKFTYYIEKTESDEQPFRNLLLPPEFNQTSKIEYKTVVKGLENTIKWESPRLMRLSTRTEKSAYVDNCINVGLGTADEFALDTTHNKIYTNFQNDCILLQFYGMSMDENNLPKVPDDAVLYEAVYTHLRWKIFEDLFYNSTVQDIQTKYQKAEIDAKIAFKEALYYVKLPSFQTSVDAIRNNRNRFAQYQL